MHDHVQVKPLFYYLKYKNSKSGSTADLVSNLFCRKSEDRSQKFPIMPYLAIKVRLC